MAPHRSPETLLERHPHLSDKARDAIEDTNNDIYVSATVPWEIVIKHGHDKLSLPVPRRIFMTSRLRATGFRELPITQDHALTVATLPAIHSDPFNRIVIARA
jgi:PIN domain nuclease of toxin-antitoxin system